MKNIFQILKGTLALFVTTLLLMSCSEDAMDKVNKNDNDPKDVDAKFTMSELMAATATSVIGGDLSLYASIYMELEGGCHNQLFYAEMRQSQPISSTTYNNNWQSAYVCIRNAKKIIEKCSDDGEESGNRVTKGIAEVLMAINLGTLTDMFGDVPFEQSAIFKADGTPLYMQPKVDKQKDLYVKIQAILDEAIADLSEKDANPVTGSSSSKDFIYGSLGAAHKNAWKKVAYGLKARYAMRTLAVATDKEAVCNNAIEWIGKSFASADEQCAFTYNGGESVTPLTAFFDNRLAIGASKSLVDRIIERNDPRYKGFASWKWTQFTSATFSSIKAVPNGNAKEVQESYDMSIAYQAPTASVYLMSFHELKFLLAEAYARKATPDSNSALAALEEAITAAMNNTNATIRSNSSSYGSDAFGLLAGYITDGEITNHIDAVEALAGTTSLIEQIMIEKYMACHGPNGESLEAYCDYRRMKALGENFIALANPLNATKFPVRFAYGAADVVANNNVKVLYGDGSYVYNTKVWWAGGTTY